MLKTKEVLTTGEVGKLLKVTTNTIAKWFDQGFIQGFTHPGSNTRRISKDELEKFFIKHGIPYKRLQKEPFLTTAQCAKCCYVTTNTITKWIDNGHLDGFTLGTERRLVFHKDLVRFMKNSAIPLTQLNKMKIKTPEEAPQEKKPKKKKTKRRTRKKRK